MLKCVCCWGSTPDPAGGAYSTPLAGFKGPNSKGKGAQRKQKGGRGKGKGSGGKRGEGRDSGIPVLLFPHFEPC